METEQSLERATDLGGKPRDIVKRWLREIESADKNEKEWRQEARRVKALARGRKSKENSNKLAFNILWTNNQTLGPALYNQTPRPDIRNRYKQKDQMADNIAEVIERGLSFSMDDYDFDDEIRLVIDDELKTGRGVARVAYDCVKDQDGKILHEFLKTHLVAWDRFRMSPARSWKKVRWVAFRHLLTRDELVEQFGKIGDEVDLTYEEDDDEAEGENKETQGILKRGEVWEIWDRPTREVVFISPGLDTKPLKTQDDPYKIREFFPIPRPLYSVRDTDDMIPVPEFTLYEHLATELDRITKRISRLINALKVRGAYDASLDAIPQILAGDDTEMVPVQNVADVIERGGIEGAIWMWPLDTIVQALTQAYIARDQVKNTIFEITGLSDILRGATKANETATAQEIKAEWGALRLDDRRKEVQRFIRDLLRIKAELMSELFRPQTLSLMTGKSVTKEMVAVMRRDGQRRFRIDIETDSTVAADQKSDQENITKLYEALGGFFERIGPAVQSPMNPAGVIPVEAAKQLLLGGIRRFKLGREVEDALDKIASDEEGQGQQVPPELMQQMEAAQQENAALQQAVQELQAQASDVQLKAQAEQAKIALEREKLALEREKFQQEIALKAAELNSKAQAEAQKTQLEQERVAREEVVRQETQQGDLERQDREKQSAQASEATVAKIVAELTNAVQALVDAQNAPKKIVHDDAGRPIGVEPAAVH